MRHIIPSTFLALLLFAGVQQVQAQVDITGTWEISWEFTFETVMFFKIHICFLQLLILFLKQII